jgi:hypothetical protein
MPLIRSRRICVMLDGERRIRCGDGDVSFAALLTSQQARLATQRSPAA